MGEVAMSTLCPVCGFALGFPAWTSDGPAEEFCPSCGIQFGYHDVPEASGGTGSREERQRIWRLNWIGKGMKWSSRGIQPPPGWDPRRQLLGIGVSI